MKRLVIGLGVLVVMLVGALVARLALQRERLVGPPGGSGLVEGTSFDLDR